MELSAAGLVRRVSTLPDARPTAAVRIRLSAYFFKKQMRDFASSVHDNAIMSPLTKPLSADDIADVAAYYAGANAGTARDRTVQFSGPAARRGIATGSTTPRMVP